MTASLFTVGLLPLLAATALMLWATAQAVRQRDLPRRLILWGALHDTALACLALAAGGGAARTGLWLFVLFQLASRLLAWTSLRRLQDGAVRADAAAPLRLEDLRGVGARRPWTGAAFALGLLAAVGGSPFLMPEARAFITAGVLNNLPGGLPVLLAAALTTTVFIWLYVTAVRVTVLEPAPETTPGTGAPRAGGLTTLLLACAVALLGLGRGPLTDLLASGGFAAPHSAVHPAYWCYYLGAFLTGLAFLARLPWASKAGAAFAALALAAVLAVPAPPTAKLFLLMLCGIGLVVAVYSLGYIHGAHQGRYWFFLLLTFASLAGIVSSSDVTGMYGYWELMTFASYFLVVHEDTRAAHDAGVKYYVMCAGGALLMLPGLLLLGQGLSPALLKGALLLCLAGFGVKAGLVPLHSWLPDAHPAAP